MLLRIMVQHSLAKIKKSMTAPQLPLIARDPWLAPFAPVIKERHARAMAMWQELAGHNGKLIDYANAHHYYGLHRTAQQGWVLREWAPHATAIYLVGEFNGWKECSPYRMRPTTGGNWEIELPRQAMKHGDLFKLHVHWQDGWGERIPAYATRVVQDPDTHIFSAQVWNPEVPYQFQAKRFKPCTSPLLIYECHIGMAGEKEAVATYDEFREQVLPRVVAGGYNAIQVMAIQEHPYYGSFGYHVSSFFAASSRFGTPEQLKQLIDAAHTAGIAVIMDLVHSHAVKNDVEGLGRFDGSTELYFHGDSRRQHPAWDSLCFDYGKREVLHFLLSNCRYWLEEYHFDGFRFDGVTSMLYYNHGLNTSFNSYAAYYNGQQDPDAITYLTLANLLIHELNPHAITIAEEMSGMPGLARPVSEGGMGFDYRMAMGVPDYWIKTIKELKDEDWKPSSMFWELTNRRADERAIGYVESHDQALVGDKTIIFRLIDKEMYWHMMIGDHNSTVDRGMALHKMLRLITATTINGGYLNFMGNEWGHPEWIDFPREGNGWSHRYARRQWSLVDRADLKYQFLNRWDSDMIHLIASTHDFQDLPIAKLWENDNEQVLAYMRGNLLMAFNFSPVNSYNGYKLLAPAGKYALVLDTDAPCYGGYGNIDPTVNHLTEHDPQHAPQLMGWLRLYLPARSAQVLQLLPK